VRTDVSKFTWPDLVEHLQRNFGVGQDDALMPYYKWRARESIKIKNLCKQRRVDIPTVVLCAEYCKAHNIGAVSVAQLLSHLSQATLWHRSMNVDRLELEIQAAVARERQLSDEESENWVSKLMRSSGEARREVLDEWASTRK
jgi:hypothetical protein